MRHKEGFKNILLLASSLLLTLIIVEVFFKISHIFMKPVFHSAIEGLSYESKPHYWYVECTYGRGWIRYKHNSLGMRDVERSFKKPSGAKRIVCIGDSIIYGVKVPFNDIVTRQLEKRINSTYPFRIEVLNCAVPSYGLKEYFFYLKNKGIKFNPDMVIVGLCLNDYMSVRKEERNDLKVVLSHSYLLDFIKEKKNSLFLEVKPRPIIDPEYEDMLKEESWMDNRIYIEKIKNICLDNNIKLLFVIFPIREQFSQLKGDDRPQRYIHAILDSLDIPYIDLRSNFGAAIEKGGVLFSDFDNVHFLPLGHKITAGTMYDRITELNLIN